MSGRPQMSVACKCGEQKNIRIDKTTLGDSVSYRVTCFRCSKVLEYSPSLRQWSKWHVGQQEAQLISALSDEIPRHLVETAR